ncbi:MAG: dimethylglycine dehydrogenase [Gammaproteobacteria bacterium]|nr:dimethylglycine dehydrogenase [Gammaproteobacteria bacterium]
MAELPSTARVVIIGGGSVGTSSLYHLAKMGWTDCVLLEKNELTSGSTWHAAGNCPNFSGSWSIMKMQAYSTALYRGLADEVDYPMNYHVTGAVRLAHTVERMREFEHVVSMANYQGLNFEMLDLDALRAKYPFIETHDLAGGCWDPTDGDIDPAQLTQALAKGARDMGARIIRFCPVTGVRRENLEWVVETGQGEIRCEYVVNAAGYRAQEVGRMFGREIPQVTLAHQYLVTEAIPELTERDTIVPLLRDPDTSYYLRQEKDGLLLGPYEYHCKAHWMTPDDPMPEDFSFQLYPDDLERLEDYIADACARVPILGSAGITRVVNGPIPYAPDGNPLIGPMPGVPNAFEACVFTFGIVQGGGAGKILAEWVTQGETEWDMWSCDPRRFTSFADQEYANAKGIEIYSHEYAMHFPHYQWPDGREKRVSPLYPRFKEMGAQFSAAAGWERVAWVAEAGEDTSLESCETYLREGPWFAGVKRECEAVQNAAGILELPGFSRYMVSGPGTDDWIRTLVTGTIPRVGRLSLVYFSDHHGRILSEMSLVRLAPDKMMLMAGAGAEWHDQDWLRKHLPADSAIEIQNITEDFSSLVLSGPRSRDILSGITNGDLELPWLHHQRAQIADAEVTLMRVSYLGELGWEIHASMSDMEAVFDAVWNAGQVHGLRLFGMYAMDSMRIEKGYRSWKQDLSTDYTMLEGGLERFVKWDKPHFIGRDALLQEQQGGAAQAFVSLQVDAGVCDAPYLATVWSGDERVGLVTSGNYGHRVGASLALAVVRADAAGPGTVLDVEIYGERCRAEVQANQAVYDVTNERLRA